MSTFSEIPDLQPEQFKAFTALIKEKAFITMKDNKVTLLSNRLRRRLRALGMDNYDDYYQFLVSGKDPKEMTFFIEVVTTNESYFWRTTRNYDMVKNNVLPDLLGRYKNETLNFWSAGCSTGEEPYNIAMELTESMKLHGVFSFAILATDISQRVIDTALAGRYQGRTLEKVPRNIINRYFVPVPENEGEFEVRSDLKKKIKFRVSNLFEEEPPLQHCIFCRNVMIYFSRDVQQTLIDRFYRALKPGGYLIIGHSESLQLMDTKFKTISFPDGIAYQKII